MAHDQQYRILISVLNWNGYKKTITCLQSIRALDYTSYDVLVVDNASTDGSVQKILQVFPRQEIYVTGENKGFAAGHQIAARLLQERVYDALWILNNDVVVAPESLSQLVRCMEHGGRMALYSSTPLQSPVDSTIAFPAKYLQSEHFTERPFRQLPPLQYEVFAQGQNCRPVAALPGSCLFIPTEVITAYGFMDTEFFLYGEEVDYCLRMGRQQVPSVMVLSSLVYHEGGGSQGDSSDLRAVVLYYRTRNEIVKATRHNSKVVVTVVIIKKLLRMGALVFQSALRAKGASLSGRMMAKGILDAMLGRMGKRVPPEDYL